MSVNEVAPPHRLTRPHHSGYARGVRSGSTVSARMAAVQPPIIPIIHQLIKEHPGTISLGQGVVHYGPPPSALQAAAEFAARPAADALADHRYGSVGGTPPLRDAIVAKLAAENGIEVEDPGELMVSAGANMAFVNAVLAIADPGDEVILLSPYFFNHEMAVVIAGCRPVVVATDDRHHPLVADIEAAIGPRTRAVVTNSPNNPSGAVYAAETLQEINRLCRQRGVYHIHDEAYEYFTYGAAHFSPGSRDEARGHTISLFSLSKSYGFASWRIGYMTMPAPLAEAVAKIQDTLLICPPAASEAAAVGALQAGRSYCMEQREQTEAVRARALDALREVADLVAVPNAEGAFYLLLKVDAALDPMELTRRLVARHRVAVLPGTAFGLESCYVRVSYGALSPADAAEGIGRLVTGLRAEVGG